MGKRFSQMIAEGKVNRTYRDPQEFMFAEEHDEAAEVYSLAMWMFYELTGKDYYETAGTPEDECFMMADPDSENSAINEKYIPEEIKDFADLLLKATVYKRSRRISLNDFLAGLSEHEDKNRVISEETVTLKSESSPEIIYQTEEPEKQTGEGSDTVKAPAQKSVSEDEGKSTETENSSEDMNDRFSVLPDHDYGIILNNKRSGRIEFKPLLFFDGRSESYALPAGCGGEFIIAVSRRHRDNAAYSNPSSVYGDRIIPVGLAVTPYANGQKIKIKLENQEGKLAAVFADISLSGEESGTRMAEWR